MADKKFPVGFWNYVPCNKIDEEQATEDWRQLGMTLAMSFEYISPADRESMLRTLDGAAKRGIGVIVCDCRTRWKNYALKGEAAYREEVRAAAKEFGEHPAFYAFHVGDEPGKEDWADMLAATKIVGEYSRPFVNFFPYFQENFEKRVGVDHAGYSRLLADALKKTGLEMLCYDNYTQCFIHDREEGIDEYFKNLNEFYAVAKSAGREFWTTLLSVGHWSFCVPCEDEIRWQISTAIAHGAKGLLWFYLYGRFLESSYRNSPFDQFYEKTDMFDKLARQNKLFNEYFAPRFARSELIAVYHLGKVYGGTKPYAGGCIEGLELTRKFGNPLILSEFFDGEKKFLLAVDNSQTDIERIIGSYRGKSFDCWLAPGQMVIIE